MKKRIKAVIHTGIILCLPEAFRDNGYKNEGLHKEKNRDFNIIVYDRDEFDEARLCIERCERISREEKEEVSDRLDQIEEICTSSDNPTVKWEKLRPHVMWLSGKKLVIASRILPLLTMIDNDR